MLIVIIQELKPFVGLCGHELMEYLFKETLLCLFFFLAKKIIKIKLIVFFIKFAFVRYRMRDVIIFDLLENFLQVSSYFVNLLS